MTAAPARLDIEAIRSHFPALQRIHRGRPVAYFDGPGGTQVPRQVADAMTDYLLNHNANTHWSFPTSQETDAAILAARGAMADLFHADPSEVVFGNNMTSLTFHLARSLGRRMGPGDEVVVTELDHHANVDPWRALEKDRGVTIRVARMNTETGRLDMDDLAGQITPRTKVLAIGAASNALGTINDVAAAVAMAHDRGALAYVDAVHYAPHRLIDVRAWDCDFLACSAYKFHGPHVGILYGKDAVLADLDVPKLQPASDAPPDKLETGTQNHEGIVGVGATVDFLASLGQGTNRRERLESFYAAFLGREVALIQRLWSGLAAIPGLTLYGMDPSPHRTPTVSFVLKGITPEKLVDHLTANALFASHGDFYATTVVKRLGHTADGLVRIGCVLYTTEEEIDRLVDAVRNAPRG